MSFIKTNAKVPADRLIINCPKVATALNTLLPGITYRDNPLGISFDIGKGSTPNAFIVIFIT